MVQQDGTILLKETGPASCFAMVGGDLIVGEQFVGYISCLGLEEEFYTFTQLAEKRNACMQCRLNKNSQG